MMLQIILSSASSISVIFRFISLFIYQLVVFTLSIRTIHYFLAHSLQSENLPFPQVLPTVESWYSLDRHRGSLDWTGLDCTGCFMFTGFFFSVFLRYFSVGFLAARQFSTARLIVVYRIMFALLEGPDV